MTDNNSDDFLVRAGLGRRWGNKSTRTIKRYEQANKIPPPDVILPNGQPAWKRSTIEAYERASVMARD